MDTPETTNPEPPVEVVRLPLWKNCYDAIVADVDHGKTYSVEFFEEHLKAPRFTLQFNIQVTEVRAALRKLGYYLTGRGTKRKHFRIVLVHENLRQNATYFRNAGKNLVWGHTLAENTRAELLDAEGKARLERQREKMATRLALWNRRDPLKLNTP